MAKQTHIHIHFAPRTRSRDQAPGSVPPSDLKLLVEALHQAIAARQGSTTDAGFDESKVKRDEGGKFSAQQHEAASSHHEAQAKQHADQAHNIGPDMQGRLAHEAAGKAHMEAAKAHGMAAAHMKAQTGWSSHHAQAAHNATSAAKQATAVTTAGPANLDQLKATASNSKASVEERAQAVAQLDKMEKAANAVAASPHAVPQVEHGSYPQYNPTTGEITEGKGPVSMTAQTGKPAPKPGVTKAAQQNSDFQWKKQMQAGVGAGVPKAPNPALENPPIKNHEFAAAQPPNEAAAQQALENYSGPMGEESAKLEQHAAHLKAKGIGPTWAKGAPGAPATQQPSSGAAAGTAPAGAKPTSAKASGAKAATHELLSSGHPFSVDELMKATGCSNKTTLLTALSDLKSEKYAGKLGKLNIVKRPDGMYHVAKPDGSAAGKATGVQSPSALGALTPNAASKLAKLAAAQSKASQIGPGGGRPLPVFKGPGGFDAGPVQNAQARIDAKKSSVPGHNSAKRLSDQNKVLHGVMSKNLASPTGIATPSSADLQGKPANPKSLDYHQWVEQVKEKHANKQGVDIRKDPKTGITHAYAGANHVGSYIKPGSHAISQPATPFKGAVSYTGEDPMVMEQIASSGKPKAVAIKEQAAAKLSKLQKK